jgi:S-DNA-T family DNA segregation ATPase FtsK/SpoIIIE
MRGQPEAAVDLVKQGAGGGYIGLLLAFPLYSLADFWGTLVILIGLAAVAVVLGWGGRIMDLLRGLGSEEDEDEEVMDEGKNQEIKINKMAGSAGFSANEVGDEGEESEGGGKAVEVRNFSDKIEEDGIALAPAKARYKKGNWELPAAGLLEDSHSSVDSGNIEANVKIIQKTLADFGIPVEMGEVNVGPTVTQYTLRPVQGIKLSQIVALQNDLALALAASSIRIEAPIPGRSLVGIEVPNKATAIVRLKDLIKTESFARHKSNLVFALGRDVAGHAILSDITRMPHLLIAGATGTGKSVAINSLLISLLFRNSPEELRLVVIDPKRVELNLYNGIPHLLTPVVTDHDKAINALKWSVAEMDRRYHLLADTGKRNIGEYNQSASDKLPYIVIIVDELADLMAVAQSDVEAAVVRLAQMARAVGIHLVLATQRPSVDIITGLIKANITARIAFAVASQVDSRTILDSSGAEKLLGAGDMLYITAELGKPRRIQGTYISEKEVRNVVSFIKEQAGEVEYSEEILEKQRAVRSASGFSEDDEDDLLPDAIAVIKHAGKASASLLQRRLSIGYARAARILDILEDKGIVGRQEGAKPRDVFISEMEDEEANYEDQ